MANDIEQRQFVDKAGLEQFWDDIQIYLTRKYKELPPGMQFSRIYQENGRLHILVEPFGGSTEDCKAASRANLDVYSKAEIDANYKTKQDGVSEQFTNYQTLLDISQDTNGEISMRKQVIPTATVGTLGLTTLKGVVSADEGDNSTAATPKAVADAIAATIAGLDVSEVSIGKAKTVGTISEVDGKIVVTTVDILVGNANIADGAVTGNKIADDSIGNKHIAADAVHEEQILDGSVTNSKIDDGAVTYGKVTNTEDHPFPIDISGNAATATTVQEGGELDQRIDAIENGKADKVDGATPGNLATLNSTGNLVDSGAHIEPSYNALNKDDTVNPVTASAVTAALGTLDAANTVPDGHYITGVGETDGMVGITTIQMDTAPTQGSLHPVTSGGVKTALSDEKQAREDFDTWVRERIPPAASGVNQLADKAYVDAIGERLEARYLSYSVNGMPFPDYYTFSHATIFYYLDHQVTPDNNDVIVISHDEEHLNDNGEPSTTRYRYIAPVSSSAGEWRFEYVINNSALNLSQLAAINSGITAAKVDAYDGHLDYQVNPNPHHVSFEQLSGNQVTQSELNVLSGVTIDTAELNTLDGIDTSKTLDVQLAEKAERISGTPGNLVKVGSTPDADGKYDIVDSSSSITQYYAPNDTANPATGSAIKSGFDTEIAKIDRTVESYDQSSAEPAPKVKVTVTQTDGALTAVVVDDSNAASKAQGDKADTAIQTVKVREINGSTDTTTTLQPVDSAVTVDLRNYKHLQSTVSDPISDGTGLEFIDSITQDETGIIHPHKKTVAVDSTYSASGTNPVNGQAVAAAIAGLDSTESSQPGQNVQVTVTQADGKITGVSVTDHSANASDIDTKINALDVSNVINEGEYITSLSEVDGKIVVRAEAMDSTPTENSSKPVTSDGVYTAISDAVGSLDVSDITGFGPGKTLASLTETDGKIDATFQDISIVKAQVSDFPATMPPTPHSHGSITDGGAITDTGVDIGNNDTLVIADSSASGTLKQTVIAFDGSTATKALTQKGTWESFKPTQVAVTEAIEDTGSTLTFISSVTQDTDGVITPKTKTVLVDNAMSSSSTNPVQNKVVNTALGTKVDKYTITQQDAYQCFGIIEDVTRWYNHTENNGITNFYQMIGWLSWWRNGTGHDQVGTAFMKYHLNYAWKLEDPNCYELEYTAPEEKIFPALLKDARDPDNVKYYFGLRTKIAWASTIQFVGRQRYHNFNNIEWIHGAGDSTELPSGVTIYREPTPMKWHTKAADYLATPRKLAVSLSNVSTDTTFSGTADVTNIKTTGILDIAHGGTGTNTAEGASNALLSGLPEWSAAPLDSTYMIRQNTSGAATFGRVPFSTVWTYFKGKMDSDSGVDISGNAATATSADLSITTDATNGDQLQIGSGTPVNIGNAAHAASAESLATPRTVYVTLGTASTSTTRDFSGDTTIPVDGILPVANGGTGASTASAARTNLGVYSKDEVNSAITAASAEFLGTLNLTDIGLSYGATNEQIAAALGSHQWDPGVVPDNNDYCFVAINNPQTTAVDEYRRFKFDGTEWKYEYTLNNSSFTQSQWDAINSGITDVDKAAYDSHLGNTANPHSVTKAQVGLGSVVNTGDSDTPVSGGTTKFTTGGAYTELNKKADKVTNATTGDLASLDGNGNLVDSGISATNVKTKQTAVADPTAAGYALSFIDSITQNANGEITPTKKSVLVDSTYSASGTNPVNGTAVAAAINTLAVSDITGFGAGKTLASLTETDGKIAATFQDINISGMQIIDSDTEPTEDSGNTVTSGGVKAALDVKADDADVVHLAGVEHITGEKFFDSGYSLTNSYNCGYAVFTLPGNSMWKKYDDWASDQKDGAHFREWRLMFPTGANYWGKIRITITGGYSSFNASGILSKTINMAVNGDQCYLNVGAYDALGYNVENEFRISDLVWNSTDSRWEVIIHSVKPQSNNQNQFTIIECWAAREDYLDYGRQITWVNKQASIVTDTTYRNAWRGMTFNWSDKPVFQSPYGYKIFDESMTIPSSNLGVSAIPASIIDSLA